MPILVREQIYYLLWHRVQHDVRLISRKINEHQQLNKI